MFINRRTFSVLLTGLLFMLGTAFPAFAAEKASVYPYDYIGEMEEYEAKYEDTLVHLARANNLGFVEIRAANPHLDPWIPGRGAKIVLPKMHLLPKAPRDGIVINLSGMRLYAFVNGEDEPMTFPIGIGRDGLSTPIGETVISWKKEGPTWRPTARMRKEHPALPVSVPPGPDNPLGTHILYLGWPQYGIHGTNRPFGIGRRVSSGCIRLYPESIVQLFYAVEAGLPVHVVDQPVKVAWVGDTFYVEAHPSHDQADYFEKEGHVRDYELSEKEMIGIIKEAGKYADHLDWKEIRTVVRERRGYPIAVASRSVSDEGADGNGTDDKDNNKNEDNPSSDSVVLSDVSSPPSVSAANFNQ